MTKIQRANSVLTLGDFVTQVYDAFGDKAAMILWLAFKKELLVLPERQWREAGPAKPAGAMPAPPAKPLRRRKRPMLSVPMRLLARRLNREAPL